MALGIMASIIIIMYMLGSFRGMADVLKIKLTDYEFIPPKEGEFLKIYMSRYLISQPIYWDKYENLVKEVTIYTSEDHRFWFDL